MHISQFFLLTFTVMVAIVIPGCASKSDDTTTTTTTTPTPVTPYDQDEFDGIASDLADLVANSSWISAAEDFMFAEQILNVTADLSQIMKDLTSAELAANVSAAADAGNPFLAYKQLLSEMAAGTIVPDLATSATYAVGQCGEYDDFDALTGSSGLNFQSGSSYETVWKDIDISVAMNCTPKCLNGSSFTPTFMFNFNQAVDVCNNEKAITSIADVVTALQTTLDTLNTTVGGLIDSGDLDSGAFTSWETDYWTQMNADATTLKGLATTRDTDLADTVVQATITESCNYEPYSDKMEATCPGFETAQELTSAIAELDQKHYEAVFFYALQAMYPLVQWDVAGFQSLFCDTSTTDQYRANTQFFATAWSWLSTFTSDCTGSVLPNTN